MGTTTADVEIAVQVLTAAFAGDPPADRLLPERPSSAAADILFGPLAEASAAHGELAVSADATAAAVWLPRGAEPPVSPPIPDELARVRTFTELTEARHPAGTPHRYLVFLGVVPGAQGRGLGSALLRQRLAGADAEGRPAYLEASSSRSRALYVRHGFRDIGAEPIRLPDGPAIRPMWRALHP